MEVKVPLDISCKFSIILLLLHITTATVYYVTPDDQYSTDSNTFTLQHYLSNANRYFISHTDLRFLPGKHNLTENLLIENINNFSLTGNRTNGIIKTILTCTTSCGVAVIDSSDIIMENIIISACNMYDELFENASLLLMNTWDISVRNVQLLRVPLVIEDHEEELVMFNPCTFQALNVLGNSVLSNLQANCLEIYYDAIDDNITNTNKLHINKYKTDYTGSAIYFISINIYDALYGVKVIVSKTTFTKFPAVSFQFYEFQGYTIIIIKDCIFTNTTEFYGSSIVSISMENSTSKYENDINLIKFSNCIFTNNVFKSKGALIYIYIKAEPDYKKTFILTMVRVYITSCRFYNNRNGGLIYSKLDNEDMRLTHDVLVVFKNTTFSFITLNYYAMYVERVNLLLKSVIFSHVNSDYEFPIIRTVSSLLTFSYYVEMSACTAVETAIITKYMKIDEFTVVNFTANDFSILLESQEYINLDPAQVLTPMMLLPCIFQFYSYEGNLENKFQSGYKLNYSILFISNNIGSLSLYKYGITYCGWTEYSAFLHTRPETVFQNVIHYINDSLEYDKIHKDICFCDIKYQRPELPRFNCTIYKLGPFYPGQTVQFHFFTRLLPIHMENLLIRIEDGPEPACTTKNRSVVTLLRYNICTKITYTIQHKSGKECDLYIKGIPKYKQSYSASPIHAITEFFTVKLLPCPIGFTLLKSDGLCQCDPVLLIPIASVKVCNINNQTILRKSNSWITGTTINNSHTYNVSSRCPFDYCLPYSLYLNPSNPDSQCQFNRTGVLCGQCHKGLSAVLGSSQCKRCSSVYLLLVIPIAIAGIALVIILFIFNLTVTDGDINGFLLYVNIVSINTSIFFPKERFIKYALISLANLDLGIETCFYDGMDDYVKMWLQLAFPVYLIMIATTFIIASRHSTRVQRLTARRALPVLATLFLLSYTKVLRATSSVLFFYYEITSLPSNNTMLIWSVDTSAPLFGIKFTIIFVASLCIFLILLFFNIILIFTRVLSYFKFVYRFKPLLDAYQGPYKDKFYFWTGFQLVMRAGFFGISALDRNMNLMISSVLIGTAACIHGTMFPFKSKAKNIQELLMMLNLHCLFVFSLYTSSNNIAVTVLICLTLLQFSFIVLNHIKTYLLSIRCISLAKMKADMSLKKYFDCFRHGIPNNVDQGNLELIPEVAYNFQEFREPLIGQDV